MSVRASHGFAAPNPILHLSLHIYVQQSFVRRPWRSTRLSVESHLGSARSCHQEGQGAVGGGPGRGGHGPGRRTEAQEAEFAGLASFWFPSVVKSDLGACLRPRVAMHSAHSG